MKKINRRKLILAGQNDHQRELNIDYVRVGMICYPAEPVPLHTESPFTIHELI